MSDGDLQNGDSSPEARLVALERRLLDLEARVDLLMPTARKRIRVRPEETATYVIEGGWW